MCERRLLLSTVQHPLSVNAHHPMLMKHPPLLVSHFYDSQLINQSTLEKLGLSA